MPDTREKLIELINESGACFYCFPMGDLGEEQAEKIADYLIANGVTFATDNNVGGKWIPVTERLPDESIPSQHYLCWYKGRVRILKYWRTRKRFESNGRVANVTHWMPLPEPPKGEGL